MKNKIEILINSDFALNQYVNNLNKDLQNKLDFKLKPNNQENLNICLFKNENYNNKIIIFLSQIEKTFLNFKKFEDEGKINLRKFEKEISLFAKKIESLSKLSRHIIFFLWPMDIKDSYYGNYNFKKEGKNWLINFTNVFLTSKISHINNLIVNDPNYNLLKNNEKIEIFDNKTKYLTNTNYNIDFISFLAKQTSDSILDITSNKKIKLIIIDLDNTIWGGEAGEIKHENLDLGPNSIKGNVFKDFQNRLKFLKNSGILLAICSKNDLKNVKNVFTKNKYMTLKFKDFSSIQINWDSKNENIRKILKELNLRSEDTLFIDDSKFERNMVKADIKDINIFSFPENLLDLNTVFNNYSLLRINKITKTDKLRSLYYKQEKIRSNEKKKYFNNKEWINNLKIKLKIDKLKNFERAEEMFLRFNQFNTSHKRLTKSKIFQYLKLKNNQMYEVSMKDKFGDYGIIGLISIENDKKKYTISHFLLSCRVFERGIETKILKFIKNREIYKKKTGKIIINRNLKNYYVQKLFDNLKNLKKLSAKEYLIR